MAILKDNMSIQCRTQDEVDVFFETAKRENWLWNGGYNMEQKSCHHAPISFQLGFHIKSRVTYGTIDEQYGTLAMVEASQLFRNLLISRRAKHGTD
jgi:hypothetical protein